MNQRIRKLMEQAQDWADSHAPYASEEHEYFTKKFAELIVRECCTVAIQQSTDYKYPSDIISYVTAGKVNSAKMIAEHFGVGL